MKELMEIKQEYDCYFIDNKYGDKGTHDKQFDKLRKLLKDDEMSQRALTWISQCYDCYYIDDFKEENDNNPFYYLEKKIKEIENEK
jgi:hypothetical protein